MSDLTKAASMAFPMAEWKDSPKVDLRVRKWVDSMVAWKAAYSVEPKVGTRAASLAAHLDISKAECWGDLTVDYWDYLMVDQMVHSWVER